MTENMKKLLEIVSENKELTAKISTMGKDDIISYGEGSGRSAD